MAPAGGGYVDSGPIELAVVPGRFYYLGAAWNCTTTSYLDYSDSWIGADVGVGTLQGMFGTNAYPGYATSYVGPFGTDRGFPPGAYDQIISVR
jgi:hypothetical protein